jgi:hypothetical protein
MRSWALSVTAALALAGCWTTTRPQKPAPPAAEAPLVTKPPPPPPEPPPVTPSETRERHPALGRGARFGLPEIMISEVEGASVAAMVRYVDLSERLEGCRGPYGQTVEIVVEAEGDRVRTSLKDSTADNAVTGCVLNALAHDLDDILAPSGTPSDRPARVKSLLTIRFGD